MACDENEDGKTGASLGNAGGCVNSAAVLADIESCDTAIDGIIEPPACGAGRRGLPCDASCPNSVCAPESPAGCAPQHLGLDDVCVAGDSCSSDFCDSDADCSSGQVCMSGLRWRPWLQCSVLLSVFALPVLDLAGTHMRRDVPQRKSLRRGAGGNSCDCVPSGQTCETSQAPACGGTLPLRAGLRSELERGRVRVRLRGPDVLRFPSTRCGGRVPQRRTVAGLRVEPRAHVCATRHLRVPSSPCGDAEERGRGVRRPDRRRRGWDWERLRRRLRNDRIQKFDNTGTFLTQVGQPGQRRRAIQPRPRRRRGSERERLRRRRRSTTASRSSTTTGTFLTKWG